MDAECVSRLSALLRPEGRVHISTDSPEYWQEIVRVFLASRRFCQRPMLASPIETRYSAKARQQGRVLFGALFTLDETLDEKNAP